MSVGAIERADGVDAAGVRCPAASESWPWEVDEGGRRLRVDRLREHVAAGRYRVDADRVADSLLAALVESAGSAPPPDHRPVARSRVERLVRDHLHLVDEVVNRVAARFPRHVERDELVDAGRLGLVEAARRYDGSRGVPFDRYAAIRIRGAVLDSTRSRDWVGRSVRRAARELAAAEEELSAGGRRPGSDDLADALGVTPEKVAGLQADAAASMLLSLDYEGDEEAAAVGERIPDERETARPDAALEQVELIGTLREAVAELPGVHGVVVRRYFLGGELLRDIAADLGVTEARVSQINSEAVLILRRYFAELYDEVPAVDEGLPGKRARAAFLGRLAERSTWRTRLAAAGGGSGAVVDLRDPSRLEVAFD
jgi:RNA polymerase sigma factor for flagellar operon FliA